MTIELSKALSGLALRFVVSALCLVPPIAAGAATDYLLTPGDVLEVSIAGELEIRHRATIQLDGSISVPRLGTIFVAGSPPSQARAKIRAVLATKVLRRIRPDGGQTLVMIEPNDVSASVVEYRPIYVAGPVASPGEQPYRPGLTVRQALAKASAYHSDPDEKRALRDRIDLQRDLGALSVSFAKENIRIWRIKAELGDKRKFDQSVLQKADISPAKVSEFLTLATKELAARQMDHENEKAFLKAAVLQADEHIAVLEKQLKQANEGTLADMEDLESVTKLFNQGTLARSRVADTRRALLLSSTRELQTLSQLIQTKRQRSVLIRQISRQDDQRRAELIKELQEANANASEVEAKLNATIEGLRQASSTVTIGNVSASRTITTIFRKSGDHAEHIRASDDSELFPGDVLQISVEPSATLGALAAH
jgi:polysaccharide export outer membrane protein